MPRELPPPDLPMNQCVSRANANTIRRPKSAPGHRHSTRLIARAQPFAPQAVPQLPLRAALARPAPYLEQHLRSTHTRTAASSPSLRQVVSICKHDDLRCSSSSRLRSPQSKAGCSHRSTRPRPSRRMSRRSWAESTVHAIGGSYLRKLRVAHPPAATSPATRSCSGGATATTPALPAGTTPATRHSRHRPRYKL